MLQKLYSAKEVAESLHITVRTLYTYVYDGRIKGIKTSGQHGRGGGRWAFTEEAVNAFLESSTPNLKAKEPDSEK